MKKIALFLIMLFLVSSCTNNTNSITEINDDNAIDQTTSTQENIIKDYDEELGVGINQNNFPDEEFIKYIKKNIDIDDNNYLSEDEIEKTTIISIENNDRIKNLNGLQFFSNLSELKCFYCLNLQDVDLTKLNKLEKLSISVTKIDNIDLSNNKNLADVDLSGDFTKKIVPYSNATPFNIHIFPSYEENCSIDVSNCPFLRDLIKKGYENYYDGTNIIGIDFTSEVLSDGYYYEIILDNQIVKHNCMKNNEYHRYTYGNGINKVVNTSFNTYDEAFDYGFNGNKWFEIVTHPYKDGTECTLKDCWTNPESCTYRYEVIVYDEQPF